MSDKLILDLGCGMNKRTGMVGLDCRYWPGVDHVVDLMKDRWPVDDNSVDSVFSSHMLEHVDHGHPLHHFLREFGRVCKDGATIEIWTPHVRGRGAFLPGHVSYLDEYLWILICGRSPNIWHESMLGAWVLNEIRFQVSSETIAELKAAGVQLRFAIRHLQNVIEQFGVFATFYKNPRENIPPYRMTVSSGNRTSAAKELEPWDH